MEELRTSLSRWNVDSQNASGSKKYRGIAKRIVLQAQKLEQLILGRKNEPGQSFELLALGVPKQHHLPDMQA